MINKEDILNICKTALTDRQFVVEVKVSRSNEIIVSIDDFDGLSIEECRRINHVIESNLDREKEDYSLEVGSPGLSNPFKVTGQYLKSINKEVEVVLEDGEKTIGTLIFADENEITISRTFTKKIENKKQQITEESKFKIKDIKSTRSVISFK